MAADRNALPGCGEIGLGSDGILRITEVVGDISQYFNQRDAQIRDMLLRPSRHDQREAIEHQLTEGGKILGQVVDIDLCRHR